MTTLGDVMVVRGGSVNPAAFPDEEFELYSIPAHDRGGPEIVRGSRIGSSKQVVEPRDVMISKIIPHIRRARVVDPSTGRRQIASGEWIVFRDESFDPDYLRHFLLSDRFHTQFMNTVAGVGGSLVRARPQQVRSIGFPMPPLAEQRRIAAILDHADALRTKRRQVLAHLDALTQSTFHDMFMTSSEARWDLVQLGELVPRIDSGTSPVCETRPAMADEFGVLKLSAVTYGEFRENENKAYLGDIGSMAFNEVRSGDVLMTRKNTRELVGAVAVVQQVRPRLLLPDLVFRLHLDQSQVDSRFFQALMMSPAKREAVRNLSSGSAASMPNISKSRLRGLPLGLPPMDMQRAFSTGVERIDCERQTHLVALEAADELFQSLQSRAFKGEL